MYEVYGYELCNHHLCNLCLYNKTKITVTLLQTLFFRFGMDLKLVLHRTTIKSGKRSRVKNQSFKSRQVDVTAKFSTSLNSSINRDEHTRIYKANTLRKTSKTNINNLENSFNCFYLRIPKCLEKQSLFCFVLYCEYL